MKAVVDTSSLISLAWSGLLMLLPRAPLQFVVPDVVEDEAVRRGRAAGHVDAEAIQFAIAGLPRIPAGGGIIDQVVLGAAVEAGAVLTNDRRMGKRALNLGLEWLRTPDLVVLCVQAGTISVEEGRRSLDALLAAGRITQGLHGEAMEALR